MAQKFEDRFRRRQLEARGKPSTWWPRGKLVEHYGFWKREVPSKAATNLREIFSIFVYDRLFVKTICQAGSGADSYTNPRHTITCTGIEYHYIRCDVLDCNSEEKTTRKGGDQARDAIQEIHAASNDWNRATCAFVFEKIESELWTWNIFSKCERPTFSHTIFTGSRFQFNIPHIFPAEFDNYLHALIN